MYLVHHTDPHCVLYISFCFYICVFSVDVSRFCSPVWVGVLFTFFGRLHTSPVFAMCVSLVLKRRLSADKS